MRIWWLLFILVISGLASSPIFAQEDSLACEVKILSAADARTLVGARFQEELGRVPGLRRIYLKLNAAQLRARILEECTVAEKCTATELGKAVERLVQETRLPGSVGYGLLVGSLVTNAAITAGVVYLSPDSLKGFVGALMGQVAILTGVAMAPLLQPISSRLGQFFWGLSSSPPSASTGPAGRLHELAPSINGAYTLMGQHAADRITNLRLLLGQSLAQIEMAVERDDMDRVVWHLGDFAMNAYRMYREVRFQDDTILRAARASSLARLDRKALLSRTLAFIQSENPAEFTAPAERNSELAPRDYYDGLLRALLGLVQ